MSALLGIDLGTSSIKLLLRHADGRIEKARESYESPSPDGWFNALVRASKSLDLSQVHSIGLSAQVGTYIIDDHTVISWFDPQGLDELHEIKAAFPTEVFIREISMSHPDIISFPIPRLRYIRRKYPHAQKVCQPKDWLIERLTGKRISDIYSWRGLTHMQTGRYSSAMTRWLDLPDGMLPPLMQPTDRVGCITPEATALLGVPQGTSVYAGCNDFFAGLLGSGISKPGDLFDLTGTSEHIGGIAHTALDHAPPVSGPYFSGCVRYGVTGSSGMSHHFAMQLGQPDLHASSRAPLFLPYLNGERCPVCDPSASGVFFGIEPGCTAERLAYAVLEGIALNLRQILDMLELGGTTLVVSGGAAQDNQLNQIKADILQKRVLALDEADASALGAVMLAGMGCGVFSCMQHAIVYCQGSARIFEPREGVFDPRRYTAFKKLYPALQENFATWRKNT